ncbi:hypothetical protein GAY28_05960 [Azospirillum brasilense]|nr:hypothetical protein [Azospirillum brasilense]
MGGPAIQKNSNIEQSGLPPIDLEQATKRDLLTWLAKVTGKEPGPATKEETLRARVSEILTAQAGPSSDGGPSEEQDAGGDSVSPPQRLSETASTPPPPGAHTPHRPAHGPCPNRAPSPAPPFAVSAGTAASTPRLLGRAAQSAPKACPAAGAAYGLTLHRHQDGGSARIDGSFTAGVTSINLKDVPDSIPSLAPGATFRIGASATTYTVPNGTTPPGGKRAGVEFAPPRPSAPVNSGSVEFAARVITHPCKGLVTGYSDHVIAGGIVRATDKRAIILGATLPEGVRPRPGDRITTPEGIISIVPAGTAGAPPVQSDPAGAAYECRCA